MRTIQFICFMWLAFWVGAAAEDVRRPHASDKEPSSLAKSSSSLAEKPEEAIAHRAKGYLLKGELKTMTANTGKFVGHDFSNWSNPEGLYKGFQYLASVGLLVGVNGARNNSPQELKEKYPWSYRPHPKIPDSLYWWGPTVSESILDRTSNLTRPDWMPVKDHRGRLHSGQVIASKVPEYAAYAPINDRTPLLATSDQPLSWPTGYYTREGEWMPSPSGPYADLTDKEKALVDSLRAFYDEENKVWHFWPGPWARDPNPNSPTYGQEIPGTFFSDCDIFMAFDDRWAIRDVDPNQGYSMGIEVQCSGFSYGRSFAEDIIFFPVKLINRSDRIGYIEQNRKYIDYTNNGNGWNYRDMYVGFYFDVDAYNKTAEGSLAGRTNDDDMMAYNRRLNFAYIWDLDDKSGNLTGMAYSAIKFLDSPPAARDLDLDGDGVIDVRKGQKLGMTDWHWFDWYARPGVRAVESSGPFIGDGQTPIAENAEEAMFRVMSGDTTGLTESQKDWYFWHKHPGTGKNLHFNSLQDLMTDYPNGLDCVCIASAGPFDLAVGESVNASFAIIMGDSPLDLEQNAEIAQLMYDNNYQGPDPPKAPQVNAVVKPYIDKTGQKRNKVVLYWDRRSERYRDIMTGYQDFEGYRVYKSTDNGKTWGNPEKDLIRDELGNVRGWRPIAQCDLIDGIGGRDKFAPWIYLGNDKVDKGEDKDGLFHSYTDYDVEDGVTYCYAVTAYDYGIDKDNLLLNPLRFQFNLESLENFKGSSEAEPQFVKVTPQPRASDFVDVQVDTAFDGTLRKLKGNGLAKISIEVVDPYQVTGHTYQIVFRDSTITKTKAFLDSTAVDTLVGRTKNVVLYDYFIDTTVVKKETVLTYNVVDINTGKYMFTDATGAPVFDTHILHLDGEAIGVSTTIDSVSRGLINGTEYAPIFDGLRLKITNITKRPYFRRAKWTGACDYKITFDKWANALPRDYMLVWNQNFPDSAYKVSGTAIERIPVPFKAFDVTAGKQKAVPVGALWMDVDEEPKGVFSSKDYIGFIENATFLQTPSGKIPRGDRSWRLSFTWYDRDQWIVFPPDTIITTTVDPQTNQTVVDTTIIPADSIYVRAN
ncbi:MAG: hypothetical protein ONB12_12290, partial [candidate division KSB1 bacterium]|nr:hypothetical protein [candidate division KSB1 bacterium]